MNQLIKPTWTTRNAFPALLALLILAVAPIQRADAAEGETLVTFSCEPKDQSFNVGLGTDTVVFEQNDCICATDKEAAKQLIAKMINGDDSGIGYFVGQKFTDNAASVKLYCYGPDAYNEAIHWGNKLRNQKK